MTTIPLRVPPELGELLIRGWAVSFTQDSETGERSLRLVKGAFDVTVTGGDLWRISSAAIQKIPPLMLA